MKDLVIYILTHNRGELLLETVDSVLNQDCNDFDIVISDNSSNDETGSILKQKGYLEKVTYIKRDKEYSPFDHFNMCLDEINTKFFIFFHDDDVMLPNMVSTLYSIIKDSHYIAVGSNALFLKNTIKTNELCNTIKKDLILNTQDDLIYQYSINQIALYPSYIYSKELIGNMHFICDVGKYSDVTWLLRLIDRSSFYWIKEPLMYYRIHLGQDSQVVDYENQMKLYYNWKSCRLSKRTKNKIDKYILYIKYIYERKHKNFESLWFYAKNSFFNLYPKVILRRLLNKY